MNSTVLSPVHVRVVSGVIKRKNELPRGDISEGSGTDAPNVKRTSSMKVISMEIK